MLMLVTPFVGVWIEIMEPGSFTIPASVTPFVGVWIEIANERNDIVRDIGHSLRGSVD